MELLNWIRSGNTSDIIAWFENPEISDDEKRAAAFGTFFIVIQTLFKILFY
jgi:hypothetical protein